MNEHVEKGQRKADIEVLTGDPEAPWTEKVYGASIVGPFAVHIRRAITFPSPYTVTHLRSGYRVAKVRSRELGMILARELHSLYKRDDLDSTDPEVVSERMNRRRDKLVALAREYGNG